MRKELGVLDRKLQLLVQSQDGSHRTPADPANLAPASPSPTKSQMASNLPLTQILTASQNLNRRPFLHGNHRSNNAQVVSFFIDVIL
jgi:hypothetical protein